MNDRALGTCTGCMPIKVALSVETGHPRDLCAVGACQEKHKGARKENPFILQCLSRALYGHSLTWYR